MGSPALKWTLKELQVWALLLIVNTLLKTTWLKICQLGILIMYDQKMALNSGHCFAAQTCITHSKDIHNFFVICGIYLFYFLNLDVLGRNMTRFRNPACNSDLFIVSMTNPAELLAVLQVKTCLFRQTWLETSWQKEELQRIWSVCSQTEARRRVNICFGRLVRKSFPSLSACTGRAF